MKGKMKNENKKNDKQESERIVCGVSRGNNDGVQLCNRLCGDILV